MQLSSFLPLHWSWALLRQGALVSLVFCALFPWCTCLPRHPSWMVINSPHPIQVCLTLVSPFPKEVISSVALSSVTVIRRFFPTFMVFLLVPHLAGSSCALLHSYLSCSLRLLCAQGITVVSILVFRVFFMLPPSLSLSSFARTFKCSHPRTNSERFVSPRYLWSLMFLIIFQLAWA